ncbi:MAG: DNA translocase FtsK 4TM domain-containing protein [candidate division Zixibacteria bacterium]|nr:DNA translocase FtsK 4TM domain-containing protein [candidate division Zixibacteria bacterium]
MAKKKKIDLVKRNRILGLLLLLCGLLIAISLVTHNQANDTTLLIKAFSNGELNDLLTSPIQNKGGILGVFIAYFLLMVFGYIAFCLPLGIWAVGYAYIFSRDLMPIFRKIGFISFFLYLVGALFSLSSANQPFITSEPGLGGAIGCFSAKALIYLTGTVFSYTIIISLILGCIILILPSSLSRHNKLLVRAVISIKEQLARLPKLIKSFKRSDKKVDVSVSHDAQSPGLIKRIIRIKKPKKKTVAGKQLALPIESEAESNLEGHNAVNETAQDNHTGTPNEKVLSSKNGYRFPEVDLLHESPDEEPVVSEQELHQTAEILKNTLSTFKVELAKDEVEIYPGPIITRFEFKPAPGVKIAQVVNLADDLALAMKAKRIRIIAPIPGKSAIGVEIPNRIGQTVYLKDIITSNEFRNSDYVLPLALGKTTAGKAFVVDLSTMPHLLIAGATGSGKSVCLNCIITSLLYQISPDKLRFILIDPKMLELSIYNDLQHLEKPVVTEMKYAEKVLAEAVVEMEERYRKLAKIGVRNIKDYNITSDEPLPYVLIIVDELADLMMIGSARIEMLITRLAQMARAVGIHLILATQRPSVDVITGLIKANFSTRIAFQVATKVDSRTILDINGAEKLLGNGDLLYMNPAYPEPKRVHGAFISGAETKAICKSISDQEYEPTRIKNFEMNSSKISQYDPIADAVFKEAIATVIKHKQGSVSLLQRKLGIGYQRAARLIDQLEEAGIVGPYDGSKAREVLVDEQFLKDNFDDYDNHVA